MAVALTRPAVGEFFEAVITNKLGLGFEQVEVDAESSLIGKQLGSTPIYSELDVVIVSIRRREGEILFNPAGDVIIEDRDLLIAIGRAESLIKLNQLAHGAV